MQFRVEQHLPGDVDEVIAALLDPSFLTSLGDLPKIDRPEVLGQERNGDVVVERVRYRFSGELSSAVTRVVDPAKLTWIAETTYDLGARAATFRVLPDHYAGRFRCGGTHRFTQGDGETARVVEGELSVSYPLVGRSIERAILSGLEEHLEAEREVLTAHLTTG